MKRHNLLAMLILGVALGGCALLVGYGESDADALASYQPYLDFDADGF
jgi:hypothetical protein